MISLTDSNADLSSEYGIILRIYRNVSDTKNTTRSIHKEAKTRFVLLPIQDFSTNVAYF